MKTSESWVLHCRIRAEVEPEGPIPPDTDWYVHAGNAYPYGPVVFYPAKVGGLTLTFNHQNHNGAGPVELPWRCGRLCVDTGMRTLGRNSYDIEPFDPDSRLAWHVHRVKKWLCLASQDDLVQTGDPFELPYIPCYSDLRVVFRGETRRPRLLARIGMGDGGPQRSAPYRKNLQYWW